MNRKFGFVLIFLILLLTASACGGGGSSLTYKVLGTASQASIAYTNAKGETEEATVALPWETDFTIGDSFDFKISVENADDSGSITCEVWANERKVGGTSGVRLVECSGSFSGSKNSFSTDYRGRYDAKPKDAVVTMDEGDALMATSAAALKTRRATQEVVITRVPTATPTPEPSQTPSPMPTSGSGPTAFSGGRFVFDANLEGNFDIYIMDVQDALQSADGSNLRQLTFSPAQDADPSWSPDGSQVVFVSDRDGPRNLYIVDADGLNLRQLTTNPMDDQSPHWSPDGDQIAFVSWGDNSADIFVISPDGSGQTNLSHRPSNDLFPAWSPNSSQIAFISDRDGRNQIYVMKADGSGQTRLTDIEGDAVFPAWSPQGDWIAFAVMQEAEIDIYTVRTDGSDLTRITDDPGLDATPVWMDTPDDSQIAFVSSRSGNAELYVRDSEGNLQQITDLGVTVGFPDWVPGSITTTGAVDFSTYTSSDGTLAYRYPSDWQTGETPHENYATLSFISDAAFVEDADFSQPVVFMLGELWSTVDYGESDPTTLHETWVQGMGETFALEATGKPERSRQRGVVHVTQTFTGSAPDGAPLYFTLKTIVHYGRFAVVGVGVSASGQDAFASTIAAVLDSIELQPGSLSVENIDFGDPAAVLEAVFAAARLQDFSILPHLCDPLHMNDVVTTDICAITDDHELKEPFVQYYATGRIAGEVEYIEGSSDAFARVSFVYGPGGSGVSATMELIQRDGLWYLLDQTGG